MLASDLYCMADLQALNSLFGRIDVASRAQLSIFAFAFSLIAQLAPSTLTSSLPNTIILVALYAVFSCSAIIVSSITATL